MIRISVCGPSAAPFPITGKERTQLKENQSTAIYKNRVRTYFSKPQNVILLLFGIILTFTTIAPIVAIVKDTLTIHPGTIDAH